MSNRWADLDRDRLEAKVEALQAQADTLAAQLVEAQDARDWERAGKEAAERCVTIARAERDTLAARVRELVEQVEELSAHNLRSAVGPDADYIRGLGVARQIIAKDLKALLRKARSGSSPAERTP